MLFNSKKLRQLRMDKGYSLAQMARLLYVKTGLKVTRNCVSLWEKGKNFPSLKSLMALAVFYEKGIEFFFK